MDTALNPALRTGPATSSAKRLGFRGVFFDVAPSMFLGSLDQTIVAAALPAITAALGGFSEIAWIVTSYLLAATVAAPIYGRLGDAFGRRTALLWALALFVAGSMACATAPTLTVLILARGLQGLGGGGLMTLAQALIGEAVSPRERGRFQGWFGAIFALASTLGPVAGGALSEHLGWRAVFWVNVPIGLVAVTAAFRLKSSAGVERFSPDIEGTLLFGGATVASLLALSQGMSLGWFSPPIVFLAIAALLGFGALIAIERRSRQPLISIDLLARSVIWRAALCVFLFAAVLFATIIQLPLLLQLAFKFSSSLSGSMLIPLTLAQVAVSTGTGMSISKSGHPRGPLATGLAVAAIGLALMSATLGFGLWAIIPSSILFGLGFGTTMPAAQTLAQWAAGPAQLGAVTAALAFARSIGGVVGAAATSAILLAALQALAPDLVGKVQAIISTSSTAATPPVDLDGVQSAFRWVFGAMALVAFLAALVAWSMPNIDLSASSPGQSERA